MDRVNLLCLLGRAGVGKTSVANYLAATYGAQVVSLAASLKRVAKAVMGFSDEQLYGPQIIKETTDPRYGMSPREFLQRLGTEGLRAEFGIDVHVNNLLRQLEARHCPKTVYVVDDTRFPDEVEALAAQGAAVIKILCTDAPRAEIEHASESAIDTVPEDAIAATVVSSRAQGVGHLCASVEAAMRSSIRLVRFRYLLHNPEIYDVSEDLRRLDTRGHVR